MRSSIAIILSATVACFVSALPSHAGDRNQTVASHSNQVCWPTGVSPILYRCGGPAGESPNLLAYSSSNYSPSLPSYGGGHSCNYSVTK